MTGANRAGAIGDIWPRAPDFRGPQILKMSVNFLITNNFLILKHLQNLGPRNSRLAPGNCLKRDVQSIADL